MNTIEKICPSCLTHYLRIAFVYLSKKFGKKTKSYDGLHQFEEQQFSIHTFPRDNIETSPNYNQCFKSYERKEQSEMVSSDDTNCSEYNEILMQLDKLPVTLNLQPYDRYYLLLESKIKNVNQLFENPSQTEIHLEEFENSKSLFKISQIPVSTGFKFIISAVLPCSYSFYNQTISQTKNSVEMAKHIQKYVRHESIYSNLSVMGLEFKKILGLGLEPRCFTYIKYHNSPENGYNFEVCASVVNEYEDKNESESEIGIKSVKEADIFSISKIKQYNDCIYLRTYLEIDLKSIIRAHKIVRKGIKEIGEYYENLYHYVAENYEKQIA